MDTNRASMDDIESQYNKLQLEEEEGGGVTVTKEIIVKEKEDYRWNLVGVVLE